MASAGLRLLPSHPRSVLRQSTRLDHGAGTPGLFLPPEELAPAARSSGMSFGLNFLHGAENSALRKNCKRAKYATKAVHHRPASFGKGLEADSIYHTSKVKVFFKILIPFGQA